MQEAIYNIFERLRKALAQKSIGNASPLLKCLPTVLLAEQTNSMTRMTTEAHL